VFERTIVSLDRGRRLREGDGGLGRAHSRQVKRRKAQRHIDGRYIVSNNAMVPADRAVSEATATTPAQFDDG
jgi:hypothetical protein